MLALIFTFILTMFAIAFLGKREDDFFAKLMDKFVNQILTVEKN